MSRDVVFLGPPGAGKGTQAKRITARLGVRHLSTGDLLRTSVRSGTALGAEAQGYMSQGRLVPDELVDRLVEAELGSEACRAGFLLDGYPRNLAQGKALGRALDGLGRSISAVVYLAVPDSVIEARLTGRRSCSSSDCGAMYHIEHNRPMQAGKCDKCGSELVLRDDDRPEVIRERLRVFHSDTSPLLDEYRGAGLLATVDGTAKLDDVQAAVLQALARV